MASQTLPHSGGVRDAAIPAAMKHTPTARTTGTLNIPPASTPAPYNNNHAGAMTVKLRTAHSSYVIAAPATNGAVIPSANRRAFVPVSVSPARRAFQVIAASATKNATNAATSQLPSHRSGVGWLAPTTAASSPITPMTTPPAPGMAVKADDRSMAERMNVRSSAALLLMERGCRSDITRVL